MRKDLKQGSYDDYLKRVSNETIPAYEPDVGAEELKLLKDVIESNWISEGKYVRKFENLLGEKCHRIYSLAFNNCTAALITGMKSMRIGSGDEIVVQSLVHSADPNSIAATGAEPIFAEVDDSTLCLTAETIDKAKTSKTKAVLYVSLYGNCSDLKSVSKYCEENDLILVNDCAPALFGFYDEKPIASYGDFATLSFFSDKTITTGEGGMLLTDNVDLINECNIYKHDGRKERGVDVIERKGFNYRLTEFQAAVGVAQLGRSSEFINKKKYNYNLFKKLFSEVSQVSMFQFNSKGDIVPHRNIIFVPDAIPLIEYLVKKGIGCRTLFMPMHSQPCYNQSLDFPITEKLYRTGVCLPSAPSLTENNINFIVDQIKDFYS